jgi:hypothetical protein
VASDGNRGAKRRRCRQRAARRGAQNRTSARSQRIERASVRTRFAQSYPSRRH